MNLSQLIDAMRDLGVERLLAKRLSPNDNSKNQVYLESGSSMESMNILPNTGVTVERSARTQRERLKAALDFEWMDEAGGTARAPGAQLILYPQYPEVRFSGFLRGCLGGPSELMRSREAGRVLFLGITDDRRIVGYVAQASAPSVRQLDALSNPTRAGVFEELPVDMDRPADSSRNRLLEELGRIHRKGWIDGKKLNADGSVVLHAARQAVGYTLEAELGIVPNSDARPDYLGWEIKAHTVKSFRQFGSGRLTLFTPEPTYGIYFEIGATDFVMQYGRPASDGTPGRMNFTGQHRVGQRSAITGLTMRLNGFTPPASITNLSGGGIELVDDSGAVVAGWGFPGLLQHWTRKHAKAVFVPARKYTMPRTRFWYGDLVRLCTGSDFWMLLNALWDGTALHDPGLKVEGANTVRPVSKARNQFRIPVNHVESLYRESEVATVL